MRADNSLESKVWRWEGSHQTLLWEPATSERRIAKTAAEKQQTAQRGSSTKRLSLISESFKAYGKDSSSHVQRTSGLKPGEQAGPESNLSHLCCWNTTCWPTGSKVFHEKGSISEPGIKDTWTERMSKRTEWRSVIQTTIGLLKEFWEASQKRKCMICGYNGKLAP